MKYKEKATRELDAAINILVTLIKLVERKQITDIEEIFNKLETVDEAIKLS